MSHYFKAQAQKQPTAVGSLLQSSAYGSTIPVGYGMTQSVLLAIWAANLRQGGSVKKFKQFKKGITDYVEDIDFLLGHNPIRGVNQIMVNGSLYPLAFTSQSFTYDGMGSVEVIDSFFYSVIAVTCVQTYSFAVNDYGGQGAQTLTGTYEVPLWNALENGPDPSDNSATRNFPYCYRWTPAAYGQTGDGPTVAIEDSGILTGKTIKVYYSAVTESTTHQSPMTVLRMFFENELGSGNEYSDAGLPGQQIIYPHFAGAGSTDIDLGASGALPQLLPEVAFKWGVYPTGDADFPDIIEDIIKSGLAQAALGATTNYTQMERGLSSYDLPGSVQKKVGGFSYDRPVTKGNFLVVFYAPVAEVVDSGSISDTLGNTWTPVFADDLPYQAWYAQANASGLTSILLTGARTPPITPSAGEFVVWSNTALCGAAVVDGSFGSASNVGNSGACAQTVSGPFVPTPNETLTWTGFTVPTLPPGATITRMYAVATVGGAASFGSTVVDPLTSGSGPGGQYLYLGTNPATIPGTTIEFEMSATTATGSSECFPPSVFYWCIDATLTVDNLALAVYFTLPTTPPSADTQQIILFEIAGADAVDTVEVGATAPIPVATGNQAGFPSYLLNLGVGFGTVAAAKVPAGWRTALPQSNFNNAQAGQVMSPNLLATETAVRNPAALTAINPLSGAGATAFAALAFKATTPNSFPLPLGDFIDRASFDLVRQQCRANGLYGSLAMTSQSSGADWLKSLFMAANAAPVYLGDKLHAIPYSEVSIAGNGAEYTAPTAAGPVANLRAASDQDPYGDFMADGTPQVDTVDRIDLPNVLQLQFIARENNYNQISISQPESATLSLYGMRKADPVVMNCVQDTLVARMLLGIMIRRGQYGGDVYSFTLSPRWMLLSPMDLVTLTDELVSMVGVPVRISSMEEQDDLSMVCEAEPFIYGMCAPRPYATSGPNPNPINTGQSAGDVNPPIIFEPVPQLTNMAPQGQIWLVISSSSLIYGGAQVYVSTDGGASYNPAGSPITGNATMGKLTALWPAAVDPDTTNNLSLDMTESNGVIDSITETEEDQFLLPCIVTGADISVENNGTPVASFSLPDFENDGVLVAEPSLDWNYELMSYAVATLTGPGQYELMATGGGNHLRRAVYDAPTAGAGITHSAGERFAVLDPAGTGIFKITLPPQWVGTELFFKVLSFNNFGSAVQSLSDVPAYSYTPTGVPYL